MRSVAILLPVLAGLLAVSPAGRASDPAADGTARPLRIVLIGASIGRAWQLAEFPARTGRRGVTLEHVGLYRFDKSEAVREVLARGAGAPDVLILKECGTYFPGDLAAYEALVRRWVDETQAAGVLPVLATVAPVAAPSGFVQNVKEIVKRWILRREDQGESIARFNDRIRALAAERGLPLLDLEHALRVSDEERVLLPSCDRGDGLHLNEEAYRRLDLELAALLDRLPVAPPDLER